jgi:hypothetical protein
VEIVKFALEDLCRDTKVEILFHARVVAALKNPAGRIGHVVTESKSGREAWHGEVFVDCTGDGDLAALAGCG